MRCALTISIASLLLMVAAVPVSAREMFPVHGLVLDRTSSGRAIVRLAAVPLIQPAATRAYRIEPSSVAQPGIQIDAFADSSRPGILFDAKRASSFVAGTPNSLATHVYAVGDVLPGLTLVDQTGHPVRFSDFRGKMTLLSFVFTRCPDATICPAISAKFLYLQQHLDPLRFHLIEVTLDPAYDSPAVLAQYGSRFSADPQRWSLVMGEAQEIKTLIDQFGISSIADRPGNFIHDDRLAIIDQTGRVSSILETIGWFPTMRLRWRATRRG